MRNINYEKYCISLIFACLCIIRSSNRYTEGHGLSCVIDEKVVGHVSHVTEASG